MAAIKSGSKGTPSHPSRAQAGLRGDELVMEALCWRTWLVTGMAAGGVTGTKRSLHLHLKKTEVLGDPPDITTFYSSLQRKKQR